MVSSNILRNQIKQIPLVNSRGLKTGTILNYRKFDNRRINHRCFPVANIIGQYDMKHTPKEFLRKEYDYPLHQDLLKQRYPGYWINQKFHYVKEMEPELIVPDLTDFKLKPYVSYRTKDIEQTELTAKALFNMTYADDIYKKYLNREEIKIEASDDDILKAKIRAQQTGADLFLGDGDYYGVRGPRDFDDDEYFMKIDQPDDDNQ